MNITNPELTARYQWAQQIAVEAGRLTLPFFRATHLHVEHKSDGSPLTLADQTSERRLREQINARFSSDAIMGEEFGAQAGTSEFRWILDPIDGTKTFVSGVPLFGTMIGIEYAGRAVAGVIYFPALDEGVHALTGGGAWYFRGAEPPCPARVSRKSTLAESVLVTTCVESLDKRGAWAAYQALARRVRWARTWGDVYGYLLVATGRAEVMIDPYMNLWDAAALLPILEEAGGCFTDWRGEPRIDAGESVGSNGLVHSEVLDILKQAPPLPPELVEVLGGKRTR